MTFRALTLPLLGLSAVLVVVSIALFIYPGPKFSIEFTGGTLIEVQLPLGKTRDDVTAAVHAFEEASKKDLGNFSVTAVKTANEQAYILRLPTITNEEHLVLLAQIEKKLGTVKELHYNTIGPSLSASLKTKSLQAIAIASIAIILYLAIAFRKLPRKLNPWKFGALAVVGFIHDVCVTTGFFIILGWFTTFEFDTLFVTALLTILAYSANDTIVIFDRIRANMSFDNRNENLEAVVSRGLKQCVTRTFSTAMAALIMLLSLFFLGSESIRWFILALTFGTLIGAYSSYFIAAPLLVYWK
ncbi:protein translocase subunit SecF [Candidatus Peribacteria bacterium]|nr:protein translocase subunit SecF [Candidatus Peribacteria bacterium]